MTQSRKLKALLRVSDAAFLAAQTRMAALRKTETAIRGQLDALTQDRQSYISEKAGCIDPATVVGADALWLRWITDRRTALNIELARVQAQKAQHFAVLKQAFGRREAMRAVLAKLQLEDARLRERRRRS